MASASKVRTAAVPVRRPRAAVLRGPPLPALARAPLGPLLALFERERAAARTVALATVVHTEGATYTKPGAQLVIAADGDYAGLLSGGCLEGDLAQRARQVRADGIAQRCRYDARSPDDLLFGLGSGCGGAMEVLLQAVGPAQHYQPLARLAAAHVARRAERYALLIQPRPARPAGMSLFSDGSCYGGEAPRPGDDMPGDELPEDDLPWLWIEQHPPPLLLLLGAGPDAPPVAELADFLGWDVHVVDHRPTYARAGRFPAGARVLQLQPAALAQQLRLGDYAAAVVMSHHYPSDLAYLRALAAAPPPFAGLLGPAERRQRLLAALGDEGRALAAQLRGPVGLDIGAHSPQAIALAIIGEIHAVLGGRSTQ